MTIKPLVTVGYDVIDYVGSGITTYPNPHFATVDHGVILHHRGTPITIDSILTASNYVIVNPGRPRTHIYPIVFTGSDEIVADLRRRMGYIHSTIIRITPGPLYNGALQQTGGGRIVKVQATPRLGRNTPLKMDRRTGGPHHLQPTTISLKHTIAAHVHRGPRIYPQYRPCRHRHTPI